MDIDQTPEENQPVMDIDEELAVDEQVEKKAGREELPIDFPIAAIKKLVKEGAGEARFSQDALAGLSRACSVFLLYASLAAQDVATGKGKSTMSVEHVLTALADIGFPEIADECKMHTAN